MKGSIGLNGFFRLPRFMDPGYNCTWAAVRLTDQPNIRQGNIEFRPKFAVSLLKKEGVGCISGAQPVTGLFGTG